MLIQFDEDFLGTAAVSLRSSLKYRRGWNKEGPTVQLLRKFMPRGSKGFRAYIPVGRTASNQNIVVPLPVRLAVRKAGFKITNYLAKKCVKLSDKEQKNEFNIGKVISKDPVAKAAFDNDPQLQNSSHSEFTMVVSCHPYDIIGMSTGRSWDRESCMRLQDYRDDHSDGVNKHFMEKDVAEGTLVAYVVRSADTNIEKPLGRCLLKPFVDETGDNILYRRETRIYGNPVPGFSETINRFLRKLNAGIPAGTYHMKKGLYNDGVGHRQIVDSSATENENRIDWTVVDDRSTLEARPALFPSFVEHMMKNVKAELTEPDRAIRTILALSRGVPVRFVKQAARLISTNEEMSYAMFSAIVHGSDGSINAPAFLKSKSLRRAINNMRQGDDYAEDTAAVTLLGSADSHKYFMSRRDTLENNLEDAEAIIKGHLKLLPADIQSRPQLHKFVYLLADITRGASSYGVVEDQETAHEILSTIPSIDTKLNPQEADSIGRLLDYGMGNDIHAAVYVLSLIKNGERGTAEFIANRMKREGFAEAMKNRRLAKIFLTLKGVSENIARHIASAAVLLVEDNAANDEAVTRDILAIVSKLDIFNVFSADNYYMFLRFHPQLVEQVFYSDYRGQDADAVYQALTNLGTLETICTVFNKKPLTPRNEAQRELFEIFCSLIDISEISIPVMPDFNYDPEKILKILAANTSLMGNHITDLGLDPAKYPQFLLPTTAKYIAVQTFLGDDNGAYYLNAAKANGCESFCRILADVFDNPMFRTMSQLQYTFPEWSGTSLRKMPTNESGIIKEIAAVSHTGDMEKLQTMYNNAYNMVVRAEQFISDFMKLTDRSQGKNMVINFAEKFGFTEDEVKAAGVFVMDLYNRLMERQDSYHHALRVFPAVLDKGEIEMSTDPKHMV